MILLTGLLKQMETHDFKLVLQMEDGRAPEMGKVVVSILTTSRGSEPLETLRGFPNMLDALLRRVTISVKGLITNGDILPKRRAN